MGPARKGATDKSCLQRAMMLLKAPGQGHKETSASDLTEQLASPHQPSISALSVSFPLYCVPYSSLSNSLSPTPNCPDSKTRWEAP